MEEKFAGTESHMKKMSRIFLATFATLSIFFTIIFFFRDISTCDTVGPEVVILRCFRDSFCALEDKRCKGENPHPVRAARYPGTLL